MENAVRTEYGELARDFTKLAAECGLEVPASLAPEIPTLAAAFECIDRVLDGIADSEDRRAFRLYVDAELRGRASVANVHASPELGRWLNTLRAITSARGMTSRFAGALRRQMSNAERMRQTTRVNTFVAAVIREARFTAALVLLLAAREGNARFRRFFLRVSYQANLVDKLQDVWSDHARGEIAIRPGSRLYLALLFAFVLHAPALFLSCPRPVRLALFGLRFMWPR
jgi:hypothetical protein